MLLATVAVTTTTGGRRTALLPLLLLLLLLMLLLDAGGVLAQDARAWYKAHPGMARIRRVNQATNQIVDDFGRTRFFHGTNVVMKEAPWHRPAAWKPGTPSFGAQDVRNLRDLGLNVVRLGHSWAGAEPTARGRYNETFLEIMRRQTKLAEDHGLYVLVDVHQDCLARQFCGHGVPDWFARKDWVSSWLRYPFPLNKLRPFPVDGDGFPTPPSVCGSVDWALSYTSVALSNAFGRLYRNDDGLAEAFAAYWQRLASGYAGARNVVGYNLLNEPWVGDVWADPALLVPGVADHRALAALWDRAAARIRAVDNHTLVWFEGATLDVLSGFRAAPLGDGARSVHSWHYYAPPQLAPVAWTLRNRRRDSERLKTAGVLTELMFWMGSPADMRRLADAMAATDAHMVSWIGWAYENLYDPATGGKPHPELARHYSRPYPAAVAGTPLAFGFSERDATLRLRFRADPAVAAPTELILPPSRFPHGWELSVSPPGSLRTYAPDNRTLALFTASGVRAATEISVTVTRKGGPPREAL